MKKKNSIWFLLLALSTIFASCKKDKMNEEQLPPATQIGANTFGCLINGKIYTPKGFDGNFTNSRINIDPTFMDGDLTIRTYRLIDDFNFTMSLSSDSIKAIGTYFIKPNSRCFFSFAKYKRDLSLEYCSVFSTNYNTNNPFNINGFIRITRYDLPNKIFSGEFEVSFNNSMCGFGDQVNITSGRFDYKL